VIVTVAWVGLIVAVVVLEVLARRHGARLVPLERLAGRLWRRPLGRVVLLGLWAFVGVHVFTRYTLPR